MWYEFLAVRQPAWLCFLVVLCFISVVLGMWVYWSVVWWGGPFLQFLLVSSSGFPAWGHFGNLSLGWVVLAFLDVCRLCPTLFFW